MSNRVANGMEGPLALGAPVVAAAARTLCAALRLTLMRLLCVASMHRLNAQNGLHVPLADFLSSGTLVRMCPWPRSLLIARSTTLHARRARVGHSVGRERLRVNIRGAGIGLRLEPIDLVNIFRVHGDGPR